MGQLTYKELLDAGAHFGHLTSKWNPKMAPYIFMEKNGIHIIDLNKTIATLEQTKEALRGIVKSGRKVMFVATKKQAKDVVSEEAKKHKMPYVTERWLGGMLTNFTTVRKSLKKMQSMDKLMKDEAFKNLAKRERLMMQRERQKLESVLGGISELTRLPAALFVVDVKREHIAIKEAQKLNIPVFAIVDTNSNPDGCEFVIPANDDAFNSVSLLIKNIGESIEEGLQERKQAREEAKKAEAEAEKKAVDAPAAKEEAPAAEKAAE